MIFEKFSRYVTRYNNLAKDWIPSKQIHSLLPYEEHEQKKIMKVMQENLEWLMYKIESGNRSMFKSYTEFKSVTGKVKRLIDSLIRAR